jgi:23S rRNA G2069 N7-methylase RlmK/C1962 C5-methylase RlmI
MLKRQNKQFDIVILDPPKFITGNTQEATEEGKQKYFDINLHALGLVATGKILTSLFHLCTNY